MAKSVAKRPVKQAVKVSPERIRAARVLHDDIGPLLSAAGLRLDLIAMDAPGAADEVREVQRILGMAIETVRALSRELDPTPMARPILPREPLDKRRKS